MFYLKVLRLKRQHFDTELPYQKSLLRQIEWEVQMDLSQRTVLSVTVFFSKILFQFFKIKLV